MSDSNKSEKLKKELSKKSDKNLIYVKVFSPYENYFEGEAQSISAENDTGAFDILPKHHNFMTLVNEGEIVIRQINSGETRLRIAKGVMHVRDDKVTVFLGV